MSLLLNSVGGGYRREVMSKVNTEGGRYGMKLMKRSTQKMMIGNLEEQEKWDGEKVDWGW